MVAPILALNAANVLQRFPPRKCSLYSHAKCVFIIFRMLFDSSICPRNPATSGGTSSVLCEDFRQGICELVSQCSNIGVGIHLFLRDLPNSLSLFAAPQP